MMIIFSVFYLSCRRLLCLLMTSLNVWDFNIIRFPSERSTSIPLSWAIRDFSNFIDSCNLIDPPLEAARQ